MTLSIAIDFLFLSSTYSQLNYVLRHIKHVFRSRSDVLYGLTFCIQGILFFNFLKANTCSALTHKSIIFICQTPKKINFIVFFYRCTVHFDICTVHSPTNALFIFKKHIKIYIKIHIKVALSYFGLRPSSNSLH